MLIIPVTEVVILTRKDFVTIVVVIFKKAVIDFLVAKLPLAQHFVRILSAHRTLLIWFFGEESFIEILILLEKLP